jgi:hypothetical protein
LQIAQQLPEGIGGGFSEAQLMGVAGEAEQFIEMDVSQVAPADIFEAGIMNCVGIGEEVHFMLLRHSLQPCDPVGGHIEQHGIPGIGYLCIAQGKFSKVSDGLKKIFVAEMACFQLFKEWIGVVLGEEFVILGYA